MNRKYFCDKRHSKRPPPLKCNKKLHRRNPLIRRGVSDRVEQLRSVSVCSTKIQPLCLLNNYDFCLMGCVFTYKSQVDRFTYTKCAAGKVNRISEKKNLYTTNFFTLDKHPKSMVISRVGGFAYGRASKTLGVTRRQYTLTHSPYTSDNKKIFPAAALRSSSREASSDDTDVSYSLRRSVFTLNHGTPGRVSRRYSRDELLSRKKNTVRSAPVQRRSTLRVLFFSSSLYSLDRR